MARFALGKGATHTEESPLTPPAAPPPSSSEARLAALLADQVSTAALEHIAALVLDGPAPWPDGAAPADRARALVEAARARSALGALGDALRVLEPALARTVEALGPLPDGARVDLAPGSQLGPYRIGARLEDAPGVEVYGAERGGASLRLVVPLDGGSRSIRERWRMAVRLAEERRGADPEILAALPVLAEAGWAGERVFAAWQQDGGAPLTTWLAAVGAPLTLATAWPLLDALLSAVAALHARGLAHGALDAATVRVAGPLETPRVALHGVGDHVLRQAMPPAQLGVVAARALAPEQLAGASASPAGDVFALGTLLWDILALRPAFPGSRALDVAAARLVGTPDPLSFSTRHGSLPDALDELALAALGRDPERRPADAGELRHRLERVVRAAAPVVSQYPDDDLDGAVATLLSSPEDPLALARLEAAVDRGAPVARVSDALVMAASQLPVGAAARRRLLHHAVALLQQTGVDAQRAEETLTLLVADDADDEQALRELVRLLEARGAVERALELLVERARQAPIPEERARALDEVARLLQDRQADAAQALVARVQAFCETPDRPDRAAAVEAAAGASPAAWREVEAECAEALAGALPVARRVALLHRLGRWYEERLARPDAAYRAYHGALQVDPGHEPSLVRAEALLRAAEHWRELVPVLLARAALAAPAASHALRAEAAQLAARRIGDVHQALALLGPLFEEDPSDHRTAVLLGELQERSGDREAGIRTLTAALSAAVGEARAAVACALARLETAAGEREAAEQHWRVALAHQPGQLEAIRALQEQHSRDGRHRELQEDLEAELAATVVPSARAAVLRRLARVRLEKLGDVEGAARALADLVALDPADEQAAADFALLLRRQGRWAELAALQGERAERAADPAVAIPLLAERAELLDQRLGLLEPATACWRRILELAPDHPRALDALAGLHLRRGEDEAAAAALERLIEAESDPARRTEHHLRAALLHEQRGRGSEMRAHLERALEDSPANRGALCRLRQVELDAGNVGAARALLEREIAVTPPGPARAFAYVELGRLLRDLPGCAAQAEGAAAFALENDPHLASAHDLLGDLAAEAGRAGDAAEHLARALELVGTSAPGAAGLRVRLARRQLAAGQIEAAVATAHVLIEAHGDDRQASAAALDILADHDEPERAEALGRAHLDRFGAGLSGGERAAVSHALGRAAARRGDRADAVAWLERAAALEPAGTAALSELARLHERGSAWSACATALRRLIERIPAGDRFEVLLRLADVEAGHLGRADAATQHVLEALAERPAERRALLLLAEIHGAQHRWEQVVALMEELARGADGAALRARYLEAAARVVGGELHDRARAVELAERALDADPGLDGLLEQALTWRRALPDRPALVRLLERRVQRLTSAPGSERAVLEGLAELVELHRELGHQAEVVATLEAARRLEPREPRWRALLAAAYAREPERYERQALALAEEAVAAEPLDAGAHRALGELHAVRGDEDGAWCTAQVLVALAQATPAERQRFRRGQPARPPRVKAGLSRSDWARHLTHPDADPGLTALLAVLESVWLDRHARTLAALGYPPGSHVDPERHAGSMAAVVQRTASLLGLPQPELVHDPGRAAPLSLLPSQPPAVALGAGALEPVPLRSSEFRASAQLIGLHPGFGARFWLPEAEALKARVLATLRLAAPRMAVPAECRDAVDDAAAELAAAPAALRAEAVPVATALLRRGESLDLTRWLRGVQLTADRAGLLACDDLETALAQVRGVTRGAPEAGRAERVRELLRFASSSDYLTLRRVLGIGVGGARATLPPPPKPTAHPA